MLQSLPHASSGTVDVLFLDLIFKIHLIFYKVWSLDRGHFEQSLQYQMCYKPTSFTRSSFAKWRYRKLRNKRSPITHN